MSSLVWVMLAAIAGALCININSGDDGQS